MTSLSDAVERGQGGNGRATMRHVAALAGVSLKTVSRVVNGEQGVSEDREQRVRDAVARLGYRHNLSASNLRRGHRTASIGVLVDDLSNDFCGELLRAVEVGARSRGVVVMSSSLDEEADRERQLVAGLVSRRCDGLILMPASNDQSYLVPEIQAGLHVVVVDRRPRNIALDSVTVDNRGGAAGAVRHLRTHGHRRIACVADSLTILTAEERWHGFRSAMAEGGLPSEPSLQLTGIRSAQEAEFAVTGLLAAPDRPTAIFCARNVITLGAVRALRRAGLQHSIALVGFDDFAAADMLEPGVTTVRQEAGTVGELAVDLLLARLDGMADPIRTHVIETELVMRGSGEIQAPER